MINLYMQVQYQLFCTQRSYCDFVVSTEKDVHIEHIYPDKSFWLENVSRVRHFFITSILPELIILKSQNWLVFLKHHLLVSLHVLKWAWTFIFSSISWNRWRFSENILLLSGTRIRRCDNPSCLHEWFHLSCLHEVGLSTQVQVLYCPDCRKLPEFKREKSRNWMYNVIERHVSLN